MRARLAALALVFAGALPACTDLSLQNGLLLCSTDHLCPPGYHCAAGDRCWRDGSDPELGGLADLAAVPDLGPTDDAAPDLAMPDLLHIDQATPPDFSQPDDAALDFSMPPDLSLDGAGLDAAPPDLSMPDLAMPDLSRPLDLSMPDHAVPPDLAHGDGGGVSFTASVVWRSGCGGTAVAPSTNRLDVSTFGTLSAGTVTAASGNQLGTGDLPVDTN